VRTSTIDPTIAPYRVRKGLRRQLDADTAAPPTGRCARRSSRSDRSLPYAAP